MMKKELDEFCDIGVIGLGVMGRKFILNIADRGYTVAGYDLAPEKMRVLEKEKTGRQSIHTFVDMTTFCSALRRPRATVVLVPAGEPVDAVMRELQRHLDTGDLIIDSGNSHFADTDRRSADLQQRGLLFLGMGMSGGENGARYGPSLMVGGSAAGYDRVKNLLESTAAHVGRTICAAYLGPGSAGHYVKMVHNGIEYGLMQLIAETYDLMKRGMGMPSDELHRVYEQWNQGELKSYLMEITADIFSKTDERTGEPLIDRILDRARQKGTGQWTVAEAMNMRVPTLNIDAAVMMRHMSGYKREQRKTREALQGSNGPCAEPWEEKRIFIGRLKRAFHAAAMITYAQGMAVLGRASEAHGYQLNLETVARIWTGGCIIRSELLEEVQTAFRDHPELPDLLAAPFFRRSVKIRQADLRSVVRTGVDLGIPVPGLTMALTYWDAFNSNWLPVNLIMAQRDYFGAHTYERVDAQGSFHTQWARA
jgi:6-phosphogluconate dehydrogenase